LLSISDIGAPPEIEPYTKDRFAEFAFLKEAPVIVSHHMRPVIPEVQVTKKMIRGFINRYNGLIRSICVGGLRVDPGVAIFWKRYDDESETAGNQVKIFDQNVLSVVQSVLEE